MSNIFPAQNKGRIKFAQQETIESACDEGGTEVARDRNVINSNSPDWNVFVWIVAISLFLLVY